jgi:hypothetical protein
MAVIAPALACFYNSLEGASGNLFTMLHDASLVLVEKGEFAASRRDAFTRDSPGKELR